MDWLSDKHDRDLIKILDFYNPEAYALFGLRLDDLPQVRIVRNGREVYDPQLHKLDFDFDWSPEHFQRIVVNEDLQVLDPKLTLPLRPQEYDFEKFNRSLYMKTARWLVPGLVSQYDPQVKIGILFVLGAIIGGVLYTLVRFLKRHGDEPLSKCIIS